MVKGVSKYIELKPQNLQPILNKKNRDISDSHTEKIFGFMGYCDLSDIYPIILSDTDGSILDGQHRARAAKYLGQSVYALSSKITIDEIERCNRISLNYSLEETYEIYRNLGIESYVALSELSDDLPHFNLHLCSKFAMLESAAGDTTIGKADGGGYFARGVYTRKAYDHWREMVSICPVFDAGSYRDTIFNLFKHEAYDTDRIKHQARKYSHVLTESPSTIANSFDSLQDLYNFKRVNTVELPGKRNKGRLISINFNEPDKISGLTEYPIRSLKKNKSSWIYKTSNYSLFEKHPLARDVNDSHLGKLQTAISKNNWLSCYPIIVDEDYTILDGFHRYLAAKNLNLPIYFVQPEGVSFLMVSLAGKRRRIWSIDDHIKYYAESENENYVALRLFCKAATTLQTQNCAILAGGKVGTYAVFRDRLKDGLFSADFLDEAYKFWEAWSSIESVDAQKNGRHQSTAIVAYSRYDIDMQKYSQQYKKYGFSVLGNPKNGQQWWDAFLRLYNYRRKTKSDYQASYAKVQKLPVRFKKST